MNVIEQSPRFVPAVRDGVIVVLALFVAVFGYFGHEVAWLAAGV